MYYDQPTELSTMQAITSTAASTVSYDVTGAGYGNAPNQVWGTSTVFGTDIGSAASGFAQPCIYMTITTAFVSGGGATLQVAVQCGVDNGSNAVSTWLTLSETAAIAVAQLTQYQTLRLPIPPIPSTAALPRFYRVNYIVATSTFSAGNVTTAIVISPPSGLVSTLYPSNFAIL